MVELLIGLLNSTKLNEKVESAYEIAGFRKESILIGEVGKEILAKCFTMEYANLILKVLSTTEFRDRINSIVNRPNNYDRPSKQSSGSFLTSLLYVLVLILLSWLILFLTKIKE